MIHMQTLCYVCCTASHAFCAAWHAHCMVMTLISRGGSLIPHGMTRLLRNLMSMLRCISPRHPTSVKLFGVIPWLVKLLAHNESRFHHRCHLSTHGSTATREHPTVLSQLRRVLLQQTVQHHAPHRPAFFAVKRDTMLPGQLLCVLLVKHIHALLRFPRQPLHGAVPQHHVRTARHVIRRVAAGDEYHELHVVRGFGR